MCDRKIIRHLFAAHLFAENPAARDMAELRV